MLVITGVKIPVVVILWVMMVMMTLGERERERESLHCIIERKPSTNGHVTHSRLFPASLDLMNLPVSEIYWHLALCRGGWGQLSEPGHVGSQELAQGSPGLGKGKRENSKGPGCS